MKKLLLIAYHFPPFTGSSGVHRASKFARYLPENDWHPYVLTCSPCAYTRLDPSYRIPSNVEVIRAFALDAQRHLGVRGRHLRFSALPDRWSTWLFAAIPMGLWTLYRRKAEVILVTYPIATAVLIALVLQRMTGKPLVVDFRDPMSEDLYPPDPLTRAIYQWIEKSAIRYGARFIFTTESLRQVYLARYPTLAPRHCVVIPNGFDEDDFTSIDVPSLAITTHCEALPLRIVHSGLIYPEERDPRPFFDALKRLKQDAVINSRIFRIDLRAPGAEEYYSHLIRDSGIADVVHILPSLRHHEALQDAANANGLLVLQAASCNHQIPAKVYEYLRLRKPILALTDPQGDTAALLRCVGGATIADLADGDCIYHALRSFVFSVRAGTHPLPDEAKVRTYTRRRGTAELARHLDELCDRPLHAIARKTI